MQIVQVAPAAAVFPIYAGYGRVSSTLLWYEYCAAVGVRASRVVAAATRVYQNSKSLRTSKCTGKLLRMDG